MTDDEIREMFKLFDFDGKGIITSKSIGVALKRRFQHHDMSDAEIQAMLDEIDPSKRELSFETFHKKMIRMESNDTEHTDFLSAFNAMADVEHGLITMESLTEFSKRSKLDLSAEDIQLMVISADKSGTGMISLDDFKQVFQFWIRYFYSNTDLNQINAAPIRLFW